MSYMEIVGLIIPCLAIIYIFENSALRSMVDKEKLEKFETIRQIDTALSLIALTFIICDLVEIFSKTEVYIWMYTLIGMIIGVVIAVCLTIVVGKYFQKKVKDNE